MSKPTIEEIVAYVECYQGASNPIPYRISDEILRILRAVKEQRDALGTARGKMFDVITAMVYAPQCDGCEGRE